jgi:hypothetical protein
MRPGLVDASVIRDTQPKHAMIRLSWNVQALAAEQASSAVQALPDSGSATSSNDLPAASTPSSASQTAAAIINAAAPA